MCSNSIFMCRVVIIIIICLSLVSAHNTRQGFYAVVVPGTIRSESVFHVSITLNDFHHSCWFNITLNNFNQTATLFEYKSIEIEPLTTKRIKLRAPYLADRIGHLEVFGFRGIASRHSSVIAFESNSYSTFIQTNKAKFKPGELVEFRVICIDPLTRPAKVNHKISVQVYDGQDNLLRIIHDAKLVQGVFRSEYQLSDNPVLGEWLIKVEIDGDDIAERVFEVARYLLPGFGVEIQTKRNVALDEGLFSLDVSSSFFYGEPVKGSLKLIVKKVYGYIDVEEIPSLSRVYQIDGNATIILYFENDLRLEDKLQATQCLILYKLHIEALVINELSEQMSRAETEISVYSQPYQVKLETPKVFHPDEVIDLKIKISITDLQEKQIHDTENPVNIFVECQGERIEDSQDWKEDFTFPIGIESIALSFPNKNFTRCELYAEYSESQSSVSRIYKNYDPLILEVMTESPEVGKELKVELRSVDPIRNFSYEIVSRGDIVKSGQIEFPENETLYILQFNVTLAMVPRITIFIHGIKNSNFVSQAKDIQTKRAFRNSIDITVDKDAKRGSLVSINVTTDPGSYVGLMALDERILKIQSSKSNDDMTEDHFEYYSFESYPGAKAGLVTFTNARMPESVFIASGYARDTLSVGDSSGFLLMPRKVEKPSLEFPYLRKIFSESWLFKDFERTPSNGLRLFDTPPDTITTWAISAFSLNSDTGLGLTKNQTKLKVFQQFFVSMELPSLVLEGEIIEVPIYIRNFMSENVMTNVTIMSNSEHLDIFDSIDGISGSSKTFLRHVPSKIPEKLTIFMKARQQGRYGVICKAITLEASDAIQKTLNVRPQGIPYIMSKTVLVHLPENGYQTDEIQIDIPENAVPESQRIEISVVGDVFRQLLGDLQKLAKAPSGNGEENMKFIVANVFALKYLKAVNYSKPNLENKLRLNIELGYQNQLSFKHLDGSFGLFERRSGERTGDVWRTAFTLWGLKEASDFIQIDFRTIKRGLKYLKSKQMENGCFESKEGVEGDVESTTLSLLVLLMDQYSKTQFDGVISRGLQCLYEKSSQDVLAKFVLLLGNHGRAEEYSIKRSKSKRRKPQIWRQRNSFEANLEIIADTIINLLESQSQTSKTSNSKLHIARELFKEESLKEVSSLYHMVALKELIEYVTNLRLDRKNLSINVKDDRNTESNLYLASGHFRVDSENFQVLQTLKISRKSRRISFESTGLGFALVEVKYNYNLVPESQYSSAYTSNITTRLSAKNLAVLELCPKSLLLTNESQSDSMVMEVKLQSGYFFNEFDFNFDKRVKPFRLNENRDKVEVHFDDINHYGVCLKLEVLKEYKVWNAKPGWIILYDFNKKDHKTMRSFFIDDHLF